MKIKIINKLSLSIGLLSLVLSQQAISDVSGIVYKDLPVNGTALNTYGVKDANEQGVSGVTVTAYQADGTSQTTVTADDGSWTLATTGDVRVEFTTVPSYLKESPDGGIANSATQFVGDGSVVNFGLHDIADYSDTTAPFYVTNAQQNGTHINSTTLGLYTVPYTSSELNATFSERGATATGYIPVDTITTKDIGSVWGKAYQKDKKRLFVASMLQRHVGFAKTPADIFVADYSTGSPATLLGSFSLQGKVPANGGAAIDLGSVDRSSGADYTLTDDPATQNIDLDAYAKVGKISYGDIDVDHNNQKLWLVNLNQKALISVDISGDFNSLSTATVNQYLIESLPNAPVCDNTKGQLRPWALAIHEGKGYVGAICDGSISKSNADMFAFIVSFDLQNPSAGFTNEFTFPLNYQRQIINWYAWEDTWVDPTRAKYGTLYGEPILSDIEFDEFNNMYLGFLDRYSTQLGANNYRAVSGTTESEGATEYGEILKICNTNGIYEQEGTATCPQSIINYNSNLDIPEFFNDIGGDRDREASLGALALLKGSNDLLLGTEDPHPQSTSGESIVNYHFTQGTHTLNTIDGSIRNWYAHISTHSSSPIRGLNGKANGMGDIELITAPAPIEIGNRVWLDDDSDGIQDAGEAGISGVTVELLDASDNTIATATTDANGYYIFSNDPSGTSTASHIYNIAALSAGENYKVRIPNINTNAGATKQASLGTNILTPSNTGEGTNANQNDSDGIESGSNADANIAGSDIPVAGANNHSYDFGFRSASVPPPATGGCTTITNTAEITNVDQTDPLLTNNTSSVDIQANCTVPKADLELVKIADKSQVLKGDTLTYTLTLTNKGDSEATDVAVTDTLPIDVTFVSATPTAGTTFDDGTKVWSIPSLPKNNVVTLQIVVTIN